MVNEELLVLHHFCFGVCVHVLWFLCLVFAGVVMVLYWFFFFLFNSFYFLESAEKMWGNF